VLTSNSKIMRTLGSQDDVLNDFSPLYFAKRFLAGTSKGVSTSSGNSETVYKICMSY
jgi:hypothetical protein